MANNNSKNQQPDGIESVQETLNRTELFIESNKNTILYVVLGLVAIVAIFFAFKRFYITPKNIEASASMYVAEQYFQRDSFNLALYGDGNNEGFLDVAKEYSITQTAKLANYYAGLCFMYSGNYEDAIKHLKKFKSKDVTVSCIALGLIGDAYVELGDNAKGASYYEKAAGKVNNEFTSPLYLNKAAQVYEAEGKYKQALKLYTQIKDDFANSQEARSAEKNIVKMKTLLAK